jgi:predicted RNase H-like HicB family nuclease
MSVKRFKVLLEWDATDSVWVTHVPSLNHLSTYGETREEALAQTREAILGYIEAATQENLSLPTEEPTIEVLELEVTTA